MQFLTGLFFAAYVACAAGIIIYLLRLMGRFVTAQEKVAGALETSARKIQDQARS